MNTKDIQVKRVGGGKKMFTQRNDSDDWPEQAGRGGVDLSDPKRAGNVPCSVWHTWSLSARGLNFRRVKKENRFSFKIMTLPKRVACATVAFEKMSVRSYEGGGNGANKIFGIVALSSKSG